MRIRLNEVKNQSRTRRNNSILLPVSDCLSCILVGFLLLVVFNATGETNAALKYLGLGCVFIAALILGFGTNFMDRLNEAERRNNRLKTGKF